MKVLVKRRFRGDSYTIGSMFINGEYFCDTLEDPVREIKPDGTGKIKHETAIPLGIYKCVLSSSPRFGRLLPELLEVPHFEYIRIHAGNTHKDTSGCILVGENKKKGEVWNSRRYERLLVDRMDGAKKRGESITVEVVNA